MRLDQETRSRTSGDMFVEKDEGIAERVESAQMAVSCGGEEGKTKMTKEPQYKGGISDRDLREALAICKALEAQSEL